MSRVALDSNVLVYLAGAYFVPADIDKVAKVQALVEDLKKTASLIAPVQALGELFVVLRRGKIPAEEARATVLQFSRSFGEAPSLPQTMAAALDLVIDHRLQLWDSLILSAAIEAGCTMLLSEDMQHGFVRGGLTIVNPLAETPHPQLARLLDSPT